MRPLWISLAIGTICWLIVVACWRWREQVISAAQVQVSDLWMVSAHGPRLGARPTDDRIVLLFYDNATAAKLGYIRSYSDDLVVYKKLLASGAKVVYDCRMAAAADAETFKELAPLLQGMAQLDSSGHLLRDIWLHSALEVEHGEFDAMRTHNVISSHPHAMPGITARLYPLTYFTARGFRESAPLVICRQLNGLPVAEFSEVGKQLRDSGIMTELHKFAPDKIAKVDIPKSTYKLGNQEIVWHAFMPTSLYTPPGAFWVSYDPSMSGYTRLSYLDVLNGESVPGLKDKLVLIGYSADVDVGSDIYEVPSVVGKVSAIEVLASAVQTLLDVRNTREVPSWVAYAIAAVFILCVCVVAGTAKPIQAFVGTCLMLVFYYLCAVVAYRVGWYTDFLVTPVGALVGAIPAAAANAWLSLKARQRVVDLFGRYVPRAIVNQLINKSELQSLTLGGTQREVTVMFADVRGFTSFSEHLTPEAVVKELNSLLEVMVECTFEFEGTLDKFIGDAILVLFNAPLDQPDHTVRAVRTALAIQERLRNHASGLKVGIGLHRGQAVIGNIGTPRRMEYTAIGSTVNIASRLCDLAGAGEVVISASIAQQLPEEFKLEEIGAVSVKGLSEKLNVVRLLS